MAEFVRVASRGEIPPGTGKAFDLAGRRIAVFNVDGAFHAIDNACPHAGGPLADGELSGTQVSCPWHAWLWDVTDGACKSGMATTVDTFETRLSGDDVLVRV